MKRLSFMQRLSYNLTFLLTHDGHEVHETTDNLFHTFLRCITSFRSIARGGSERLE